jgi:hypothetical protein
MGQQHVLYPEQTSFELGATDKGFAHFDERSYHENTHLNGFRAIQDVGSHDGPVFGESMRQVFDMLPSLKVANCDLKRLRDSASSAVIWNMKSGGNFAALRFTP